MKTVLLRAPLLCDAGYGVHARQIARWLFDLSNEPGVDIEITTELLRWGSTHWNLHPDKENGLIGKILDATNNPKPFYDVTIQLQLPNEWNPNLGRINVGVTAGVETTICNPKWIDAVNQMTLVVVPSMFAKQTFLSSGIVSTPILVIPEAFPDEFLGTPQKDTASILSEAGITTPFNFLSIGQITGTNVWNDRKNIPLSVKWFVETFADKPDVGLVIKTNISGAGTKLDRAMTKNMFNKLLTEVGLKPNGNPKVWLLHGNMSNQEMKRLYCDPTVKALVNLTRGEGFCLPALEASACGLPVITTNWSAHTEFLGLGRFIKVEYALEQIHESRIDENIFMKGARWAMPSETEAKKKFRKLYDAPVIPAQNAAVLASELQKRYCFPSVASMWSEALKNILTDSIITEQST